MSKDFSDLRREYLHATLSEADMSADPVKQFDEWFRVAAEAGIDLPNAMSLATVGSDGRPAVRVVLLKDFDRNGFVFYTHAESPKGEQIRENPNVALLFYWAALDRQVRISGKASLVSTEEADAYFRTRPFDSRLAAWIARQSSVIRDRTVLDERMRDLREEYGEGEVPRPADWLGYRVSPEAFEFWQGRESRLHDRLLYTHTDGNVWKMQRLAP